MARKRLKTSCRHCWMPIRRTSTKSSRWFIAYPDGPDYWCEAAKSERHAEDKGTPPLIQQVASDG